MTIALRSSQFPIKRKGQISRVFFKFERPPSTRRRLLLRYSALDQTLQIHVGVALLNEAGRWCGGATISKEGEEDVDMVYSLLKDKWVPEVELAQELASDRYAKFGSYIDAKYL